MARVLVVDDAMFMRRILTALLTQAGHTVVAEAANGEEAYVEYIYHKPDLVTMDITMPGSNGIDAVKRIMENNPKAKVIMISAITQKELVIQAIKEGAKHFIIKPVTAEKLNEVVNQIMANHQVQEPPGSSKVINKSIMDIHKAIEDVERRLKEIDNM